MKRNGKTDWEALKKMEEEDIDLSDIPEFKEEDWKNMKILKKENKQSVTIRYDKDVIDWFKKKGKGYQTLMNDVLKTYIKHQNT